MGKQNNKQIIIDHQVQNGVFQVALVVKNLLANTGDTKDASSIPGSERPPRGRHVNPLQYSCLENPMDRGEWWAIVHRVAETDTTEVTWHACTN